MCTNYSSWVLVGSVHGATPGVNEHPLHKSEYRSRVAASEALDCARRSILGRGGRRVVHGSTRKPKSPFWALEKGGRNVLPPHFALWQNRVGASLAAQDPIKCAQDAQRAPSGAPSPRWDRARRAGPFHVTWFTFGGGQIARGVTRRRRGIGATDLGPRSLPACAYHPRQTVTNTNQGRSEC